MKFNVTFRCSLPIDFEKHPAGEELADYIVAKLGERSLNFRCSENSPDYAWLLETQPETSKPTILIGHVDDGPHEWLAQVQSSVGLFGRMLGRSDQAVQEQIAKSMHDIFKSDSHFSDVR